LCRHSRSEAHRVRYRKAIIPANGTMVNFPPFDPRSFYTWPGITVRFGSSACRFI
jgi:hypothetical protein